MLKLSKIPSPTLIGFGVTVAIFGGPNQADYRKVQRKVVLLLRLCRRRNGGIDSATRIFVGL